MANAVQEGWKRNAGILKGPGIPAPSGQYRVGCADLMHRLEGDDKGDLILRLHYPTDATPEAGYPYSLWHPQPKYIEGYYSVHSNFPQLMSGLFKTFSS